MGRRIVAGMLKFMRLVLSVLDRRFRSQAIVELENLAPRHQLNVLRRQRPGLGSFTDRAGESLVCGTGLADEAVCCEPFSVRISFTFGGLCTRKVQ